MNGDAIEFGDDPTALYRLFDADGVLLYVGIAFDPRKRMQMHAHEEQWWGEVARRTLTWYGTRAEASDAENAVMDEEKPRYNQRRSSPSVASRYSRYSRGVHQPILGLSGTGYRPYYVCCQEGPNGHHSGKPRFH